MALISPQQILQDARAKGYGIGAFNIHTLEMLQAIIEAAQATQSPVIIQTSEGTIQHLGLDYIVAVVKTAAKTSTVPIALHLDHADNFDLIVNCIRAGYTSVMVDASDKSLEENQYFTKKVVEFASYFNVCVEAEVGEIGSTESIDSKETVLAEVSNCLKFVHATGVQTLAPSLGSLHGLYQKEPQIDFNRLRLMGSMLKIPLVLHGGSGIRDKQLKQCIKYGVAKINISSELKQVYTDKIKLELLSHPERYDPLSYLVSAKQAVQRKVVEKIQVIGSSGKGDKLRYVN